MKCPRCGNDCWRDEHPDGTAVGLYQCVNGDWSEEPIVIEDVKEDELPY